MIARLECVLFIGSQLFIGAVIKLSFCKNGIIFIQASNLRLNLWNKKRKRVLVNVQLDLQGHRLVNLLLISGVMVGDNGSRATVN